jgi:DNA invertase Pin-like site-specific DNA recombinase
MAGNKVFYKRVSSVSQTTDRQIIEGIEFDKVFEDKASAGSLDNRPALKECLTYLRAEDTLYVYSIDRLCRNLVDMKQTIESLNGKGTNVVFHKENLTFLAGAKKNPMQDLLLNIMSSFAEFEKSIINERQKEGIKVALDKGVKFGPKMKLNSKQIEELKLKCSIVGHDKSKLAIEYGVSRPTLYKVLEV